MRSSAIIDRVAALLERSAPFDRLREDRRRLLAVVLIEFFEAGEVVLEQGRMSHEYVYMVESGFVRLVDTGTGRLVAEYGEGGRSHGLRARPGRAFPRAPRLKQRLRGVFRGRPRPILARDRAAA